MLTSSQSIKYKIYNNCKDIGEFKVSNFLNDIKKYKIPFEDSKKLVIDKIGVGTYDNFDAFIIESLNDYYKKLTNPSDVDKKEDMLEIYSNLYSLWENICKQKDQGNYIEIRKLYNKITANGVKSAEKYSPMNYAKSVYDIYQSVVNKDTNIFKKVGHKINKVVKRGKKNEKDSSIKS